MKGWRATGDWAKVPEDRVTVSKSVFSTGLAGEEPWGVGGAPQSPRLPPRKFLLESGLLLQELGWRPFLLSVPQVAPSSRKPSLPSLCWETPRQSWLNGPMDTLTTGRERVLPGSHRR